MTRAYRSHAASYYPFPHCIQLSSLTLRLSLTSPALSARLECQCCSVRLIRRRQRRPCRHRCDESKKTQPNPCSNSKPQASPPFRSTPPPSRLLALQCRICTRYAPRLRTLFCIQFMAPKGTAAPGSRQGAKPRSSLLGLASSLSLSSTASGSSAGPSGTSSMQVRFAEFA